MGTLVNGIAIFWLSLTGSFIGDNKAFVIKFDPQLYNIELSMDTTGRWGMQHHIFYNHERAVAAMNASVYSGYLLDGGLTYEGEEIYPPLKNNMKGRVLFGDTVGLEMNPQKFIDYPNYINAFRMVHNGKVVWHETDLYWSMSVMGRDKEGFIYFIHTRSPYTVSQLSEQLIDKLGLVSLIYNEGGSESALTTGYETSIGSYESGYLESDSNEDLAIIPYAFIVVPKNKQEDN